MLRSSCLALLVLTSCSDPTATDDSGVDASAVRDAAPDAPSAEDAGDDVGVVDAGPIERPEFRDFAVVAGLALPHTLPAECSDPGRMDCEADHMTGGAAVGDFDGDGWPDLYVTRLGGRDFLFRNLGDSTFEEVGEAMGLGAFDRQTNGAAWADVDRDGDLDLYVSVLGTLDDAPNDRNYLFINQGASGFTEEAVARGVALQDARRHGGTSVAVGDYDLDGYVDLHVNEWTERPAQRPHTRLLRNRGASDPGVFDDVTLSAGVLTSTEGCWNFERFCTSYAFASSFTDFDGDGHPDLAIVSDFGTSRLFWNQGDGTFELGFRTTDIGGDENGMGSTIGDMDGDGDFDWFVSSIRDEAMTCTLSTCTWGTTGNRYYRNDGGRTFTDQTDTTGVRDGGWGWGAAMFDYDNDGDLDLVQTNGQIFPAHEEEDPYNEERMRFWENSGDANMTELATVVGLHDERSGKGLVVFDYDRDGDLDIFIVNNGDLSRLYRNLGGNDRPWLRIQTVGTVSNLRGLGARVQVDVGATSQVREVGSVTHFLGQSETVAHFGLGDGVTVVDRLEVRWPSGRVSEMTDVAANQELTIVEP